MKAVSIRNCQWWLITNETFKSSGTKYLIIAPISSYVRAKYTQFDQMFKKTRLKHRFYDRLTEVSPFLHSSRIQIISLKIGFRYSVKESIPWYWGDDLIIFRPGLIIWDEGLSFLWKLHLYKCRIQMNKCVFNLPKSPIDPLIERVFHPDYRSGLLSSLGWKLNQHSLAKVDQYICILHLYSCFCYRNDHPR